MTSFEGDQDPVRLRHTGQVINPKRLPEGFIDAVRVFYEQEGGKDPYTVLAVHAYLFTGLKINQIRDLFILSDGNRVRRASREYVRQKVVNGFMRIGEIYRELYGENLVSPLFPESNIEGTTAGSVQLPVDTTELELPLFEEGEDSGEEAIKSKKKVNITRRQQAAKVESQADRCPGRGNERDGDGDRPGNEVPRVVDLASRREQPRGLAHRLWDSIRKGSWN